MIWQLAKSEHYPGLNELVYAPRWYYTKEVKKDEYSTKIFHSKKEDKSWFFKTHLTDLINEMIKEMGTNFRDIDLITIIPSHEPGIYSVTLDLLAKFLSNHLKIKYEKIVIRIKTTRPGGKRHRDATERYKYAKDSMNLSRRLTESKILIFDDVKTTGTDILETKKILLDAGAKSTMTICLGINTDIVKKSESMIVIDEEEKKWIELN